MKAKHFGRISRIRVGRRPGLSTFFDRLQWPTFGFDGAYEYDRWCSRPGRKLRLIHFDGMDGAGKTLAARSLYMDFLICGYPIHLIDESWYDLWGPEKRRELRRDLPEKIKEHGVYAMSGPLSEANSGRTKGTLELVLPWLRHPVTFLLDRSYVSSLAMNLFDAVRMGLVADNPDAWEKYLVGDDPETPIYMDGDNRGPTPAWDAMGEGVFAADLQLILLARPDVSLERAKERAERTGKPLGLHETGEYLALLRRIYLFLSEGLQGRVIIADTSISNIGELTGMAWFATEQIRREHDREINRRHPEIAAHRAEQARERSSDHWFYTAESK